MKFRWSVNHDYLVFTYRWCPEKQAYILVQGAVEETGDQAVMPQLRALANTAETIADLVCLRDGEREELERVATELEFGE